MKSVVVGASAGLGRELAVQLAARGHELFLVSSDAADLAPLASDLTIRFQCRVHYAAVDLIKLNPSAIRGQIMSSLGSPRNLFCIAGQSTKVDRGSIDDALLQQILAVNFTSMVRIINALLPELMATEGANIVGAGSVAGSRPRRNNAVYGAAKKGLEFYFGTLRHLLASTSCRVQFYRIGYLETGMTFGQALLFPALDPARAATAIIDGLGSDLPARYLPRWWLFIMTMIKAIPWPIFKNLDV